MVCKICGSEIRPGAAFCAGCGTPVPSVPEEPAAHQFCPQCGSILAPGAAFCANCGAAIPAASFDYGGEGEAPKKKLSILKIALIALGAVAVLLCGIFALKALTSGKGSGNYLKASDSLYYTEGDDCIYIYDKENHMVRVSDSDYIMPFGDRSNALVYGDDDRIYFYEDGKATLLSDDGRFFAISSDGKAAVYGAESDYEDFYYDLYLYRDGKTKLICQDKRVGAAVLSPDGSTVVYSIIDDNWETVAAYLWDGKTAERNDLENAVSITDDGKLAYVTNSDRDALYAITKKGREFVGDYDGGLFFNYDDTEVVFQYNGSTYYSADGKEAVEISSKACTPMTPPNTYAIKHFKGTLFVSDSGSDNRRIFYLDKNLEMRNVASGVTDSMLASDGKTIVYLKDDALYRVDGTKKNAKAKELVSSGVKYFSATEDGKAVYYANKHGELYYVANGGKSTYLHDVDTNNWYYGYSSGRVFNGDTFVFSHNDTVYLAEGKKIREVPSLDLEDVSISCDKFTIVISGRDNYTDDWTYYRSKDGKNFIRLEDD